MKRVSSKFLKFTSMGIIFSFIFSAFIYISAGANVSNEYVWTEDSDYKSQKYFEQLTKDRDKKLEEILDVEDISEYMDDMKSLYDLCVERDKVEEVEEIMSDYEGEQVYIELLLLTGDENLAKRYRDDQELKFKFERVV